MRGPALLVCVLAFVASGCSNDSGDSPATIRVFAASSTVDVLEPVGELYRRDGGAVEFNHAGSSALREQILDGAQADIFVSANETVMANVIDAGAAVGEPVEVAQNTMMIAVPLGNPGEVSGVADFADHSLALGLCASGVPCGDLAATVLSNSGVDAAVDTFEPNVRSLLAKVELGELDAALVYRTDVLASDEVEGIELPPEVIGATRYLAVALEGSGPDAQRFIEFLSSGEVQSLFVDAGFGRP